MHDRTRVKREVLTSLRNHTHHEANTFWQFVVVPTLPEDRSISEIGQQAVWTVTSAKPGNGVDMLRDNKEDTYWQSDGAQPHLVNIQFQRKVCRPTNAGQQIFGLH